MSTVAFILAIALLVALAYIAQLSGHLSDERQALEDVHADLLDAVLRNIALRAALIEERRRKPMIFRMQGVDQSFRPYHPVTLFGEQRVIGKN